MDTKILKALWGMEQDGPLDAKLRRIKDAGYDGIECGLDFASPAEWKELREKYGLDLVAMVFADDIETFCDQLEKAKDYGPLLVTAHSGLDRMTVEEGCEYLMDALKAESESGLSVAHETHRHRLFYSPWVTLSYIEEFPDIKLCADFSHWCVVTESLLQDMGHMVSAACSRTVHIHGRVGYEQGPQVPDPRAPECAHLLERFESWWDGIAKTRKTRGARLLTFTPEYGPPAYLQTLPYTGMPVANLWDICLWSAQRARTHWALPFPPGTASIHE